MSDKMSGAVGTLSVEPRIMWLRLLPKSSEPCKDLFHRSFSLSFCIPPVIVPCATLTLRFRTDDRREVNEEGRRLHPEGS